MLGLTFKCHALLCAKLITFFVINNLIEEYNTIFRKDRKDLSS